MKKQVPGKKSEIRFTAENVSPLKYLFPANGLPSYKWSGKILDLTNKVPETLPY
ncbi:hypothetical protein INT47_012037 [Mucor saturninus]|uniref:Uncharacterized protein n=1 Tax=Mucor saturninus TaxID=64648 RepID=A0A8H7QPT3_9FUNG|nr:hypothetical protein INT47_012037 [Mucor saturninus]